MRKEGFLLKRLFALSLIVLLAIASTIVVATAFMLQNFNVIHQKDIDFHLGVAFGGNTTAEAKLLIDRVKGYTNLFVVQSGPVSVNETSLNEIVDYAVACDLDVIVYFGWFNPDHPWQVPWLDFAKQRWSNRFIGVYLNDEPAGILIDFSWTQYFLGVKERNASHYYLHAPAIDLVLAGELPLDLDEAADHFVTGLSEGLGIHKLKDRSITAFTSDYVLYWFDFLSGYDVLLAQFGWNHSINQDIALARGAARMQNKTWGAILTWTYEEPPYLASGSVIYSQMVSAYISGAKYVVIFNYPQISDNPYGIMTDEHFFALEKFWHDIPNFRSLVKNEAEVVLVLPRNYGWGMRHPNDSIWGVWDADERSAMIWDISRSLLAQYSLNLDIIYEDENFPVKGKYDKIFYWNQTL
jgi:hypothetical protein